MLHRSLFRGLMYTTAKPLYTMYKTAETGNSYRYEGNDHGFVVNVTCVLWLCTDGDVELIEKGKALLGDVADAYIAKRTESIDTDEELPEIRFYYEGVEVRWIVYTEFIVAIVSVVIIVIIIIIIIINSGGLIVRVMLLHCLCCIFSIRWTVFRYWTVFRNSIRHPKLYCFYSLWSSLLGHLV